MKAPRILLVNVGRPTETSYSVSPPLGLLYLAAYSRQSMGAEVRIVDQRARDFSPAEVVRQALDYKPDVVGLRCLTPDEAHLIDLARGMRAELPRVLILAGGPHASSHAEALVRQAPLDAVVRGEGELSFDMILRAHMEGGGFTHIPGLIWRDSDGGIIQNPGFPPIVEDLDTLPMPAYDLVDPGLYWHSKNMSLLPRRRYLSLFTSRGCPYRCNYCHSIFGKRFRAHSPGRIVEEIRLLNRSHGVLDFDILDDCFNFDRRRVLDFSEAVQSTGLKTRFVFPNALRTDILDQEGVDALARMGTYMSAFALESGSPRIQKLIGKRLNIDRYLAGVEMAAKRRIFCYGFAMLGFPGETLDEMRMTIDVACRSKLHAINFFVVIPFPGTALYREVLEKDPAKLGSFEFQGGDYLFKLTANLSEASDAQLLALVREANRRFYLNPVRLVRLLRNYPDLRQMAHYAPIMMHLLNKRRMR